MISSFCKYETMCNISTYLEYQSNKETISKVQNLPDVHDHFSHNYTEKKREKNLNKIHFSYIFFLQGLKRKAQFYVTLIKIGSDEYIIKGLISVYCLRTFTRTVSTSDDISVRLITI